ncbi:MAG: glycosyltransferase [Candidatus Dormibacteria bacterium]
MLATAQALREADPDGAVVVVGRAGGVAERLVTDAGLPLRTLRISGVDVSRPVTVVRALTSLPSSTLAARRLLRQMRPDVVVGGGGYVCVPVVAAAQMEHLPVVLMEQNAYPGRATRLLARRARVVATSFAETRTHLRGARTVVTGNPVRPEVRALAGTPTGDRCTRVLVTGGSQGARRINRAISGCVEGLLSANAALRVTHQCGVRDADEMSTARNALPDSLRARYELQPFFDDIARRIADADLVVMRAGGSSLAECSTLGRPMILVPYPHAGGHQAYNATPYVRAGAAVLVEDEQCTPARMQREVLAIVDDRARWCAMAEASRSMGRPDAADRVVDVIFRVAAHTRGRHA